MPIYKDKEIEIVSKEEAMWKRVKEAAEIRLKQNEEGVIIEKAVILMASGKIQDENKNKAKRPKLDA